MAPFQKHLLYDKYTFLQFLKIYICLKFYYVPPSNFLVPCDIKRNYLLKRPYCNSTKLVSVDFLNEVNNLTMGQTLFYILTNYNISFNKPVLFLSDSAAYM